MQYNIKKQTKISETILAAIPLLVIVTMLYFGWRKWPDILVDFGRELYLPWQVSAGKLLYRDLEHVFGPFSVYLNATIFSLFGPSFTVMFTANITLYILFMAFLYHFIRQFSSSAAASATCSLLAVVSLSQNTIVGNYNFICPYSHEAIHGLMLSMVVLHQLWRFSATGRSVHLFISGILLGCVLLTRVEIALVTFFVSILFFVIESRGTPASKQFTRILFFLAGAVFPISLFALYFSAISSDVGLQFVLIPWRFMLDPGITGTTFYKTGMGLNDISGNLLRMTAGGALFLLPLILLLVMMVRKNELPKWPVYALAIYFSVIAWNWNDLFLFPALPLINAVTALFLLYEYWQSGNSAKRQYLIPFLLLSFFSFGVLGKMFLNCRIYHYGFYVTLPALSLISVMLTWYLPSWLVKKGGHSVHFRNAMLFFLTFLTLHYFWISANLFRLKTYPVALVNSDRILTFHESIDPRGILVNKTLQWIDRNIPQDKSLLIVPEGIMLNYLTRRENPTRYNNFMLPELIHYGENAILDEIKSHPPDFILVVFAKDPAEYGVGPFGLDPANGQMIMNWIESAYCPVALIGGDPLEGNALGMKVYYKNTANCGNASGDR
jgi:hypothetical protein